VNYTNIGADHSYGSSPDGQSFNRLELFYATPGTTNNARAAVPVVINEWMAGNTNTLRDPVTGKFDDWFELYNYGEASVNLGGLYLSHSATNPFEFQIPGGYIIAPHGFLLVWADKQLTNGTPDLHANFKLSKSGTTIGLFATNGIAIDLVSFGQQTSDISMGRYPNGDGNIFILPKATPKAANAKPNTAPTLVKPGDKLIYLGQTLSFTLQASDDDIPLQTLAYRLDPGAPPGAAIDSASGAFTWTPSAVEAPSTNVIAARVTDNGIPPLSSEQTFTVIVGLLPQLSAAGLNGNQYVFAWPAASGQSYQLQYKDDLTSGTWTPVGAPLTGTDQTFTLTNDVSAAAHRFFRLQILP